MRFGVLGPLEVRGPGGELIPVGGPRPRALLVMLLLNAGQVVGVEALIDGQYGEDPPAGAANAVQAQVSRLRRALGAGRIEFRGGGYLLAVDPGTVDAHRFERLARQGRHLLSAGRFEDAAGTLRQALGLWRGPALPDLPFGQAQAARLEELRLTAGEDLAEAELALPGSAPVAELRRLVSAHPLRERLRAQLMRALHAAGRQAEALAAFEEGRRLLADELGADPSPELAAAHLTVLRAEPPAPAPRRLPAQLTSFVGREHDLALLASPGSRLRTIVGPGGIGKTRLAIEAAARDSRETYFADLSPLPPPKAQDSAAPRPTPTDAEAAWDALPPTEVRSSAAAGSHGVEQVARVVLGALGVREGGLRTPQLRDPVQRLVSALAERDTVIVLDNCEHLIASAAALVRTLLAECPRLCVLATSREPLGITGEALVPLTPLAIPPPEPPGLPTEGIPPSGSPAAKAPTVGMPVVEALGYPAVRLFADRAAAVRPAFEVRQDNVDAVVRICATLDGLPLAIELAAARLRSFDVAEIAARLAEHGRFRLLSRGDRTGAARHRALRAVVEWSWDLLTPEEQTLARRFAVFTGGATIAAVEAVCERATDDVAGVLADLVDKSLVGVDGGRYRMLETIRLFCAERLAEAGEEDGVRGRHARWYEGLARRADPWLRRGEQLGWLALLTAEHGNLMAALRWAVRHDPEAALRMVTELATCWWLSGRQSQAGDVAAELLKVTGAPLPGLEEAYVMCVLHAVPRAAPEHWARAEAYMSGLERPLRHPFTAALWGMTVGPPALPVGPERDGMLGSDPWSVALGRLSRALLRLLDGEPAEAEVELEEVLARFRALGERWGIAQALDWLAVIASWRGEWDRCRVLWREALELLDELGALEETADVLARRGEALVRAGELAAASVDFRRAGEAAARAGRSQAPVMAGLGLGELAWAAGDSAEALRRLEAALAAAQGGGFGAQQAQAHVLAALARLSAGEAGTESDGDSRRDGGGGADGTWVLYERAVAAACRSPLGSDLADAAEWQSEALLAGLDGDTDRRTGIPALARTHRSTAASAVAGRRGALLLGVAVALRGVAVAGDPHVARTAEAARRQAGAEGFAVAFARGARAGREEALTVLDQARAWVSADRG
ncbi:BTAD domain-containing putative transcriptional regulator [Nonomuraea glycinis]|uniref:BTAD domain-containing putative transcriptional regulator n=1 Tax=Nonomuraea glycinis TaxID=2047744 RepID=UPI0033AA094F